MQKKKEQQIAVPICIGAVILIILFFLIDNETLLEWFFSTFIMLVASLFLIKPIINNIIQRNGFNRVDFVFIFIGVWAWVAYVLIARQPIYDSMILFLKQVFTISVLLTFFQWIMIKEREP